MTNLWRRWVYFSILIKSLNEKACTDENLNLVCCVRLYSFGIRLELLFWVEKFNISQITSNFLKLSKIRMQSSMHEIIAISGVDNCIWLKHIFRKLKKWFHWKMKKITITLKNSMERFSQIDKLYERSRRKPGWRFTAGL